MPWGHITLALNFTGYRARSHSLFHPYPDHKGRERGDRQRVRRAPCYRLGETLSDAVTCPGAHDQQVGGASVYTAPHSNPARQIQGLAFSPLPSDTYLLSPCRYYDFSFITLICTAENSEANLILIGSHIYDNSQLQLIKDKNWRQT